MSVNRKILVDLTPPLTQINIPILEADAPNIFVTISSHRPTDETDPLELAYSQPELTLVDDSVEVIVPIVDKQLTIELNPLYTTFEGVQVALVEARVLNERGEAVSAELSFSLTDNARSNLSAEPKKSAYDRFYGPQPLQMKTFSTHAPARFLINNQYGCGLHAEVFLPNPTIQDFDIWFPQVATDAEGKVTQLIPLRRTADLWRLRVVAVTADTQIGEAELLLDARAFR